MSYYNKPYPATPPAATRNRSYNDQHDQEALYQQSQQQQAETPLASHPSFYDNEEYTSSSQLHGLAAGTAAGASQYDSRYAPDSPAAPLRQNQGYTAGNYVGEEKLNRSPDNPYALNSTSNSHKKRNWIISIVSLLVLAGIGAGIAVWRVQANKSTAAASTSTNSPTSVTLSNGTIVTVPTQSGLIKIPGTAGAVLSNPSDSSQFQKDPRLHVSFYGLAYTPFNAQAPTCGATLANITEDLQIISQMTTRIRMYGSACNQSQIVLQAIQNTKVNLTVWLGIYIGPDETVNAQQFTDTITALKIYGATHVSGVTVGNEYILNAAPGAAKVAAVTYLNGKMAAFRALLKTSGLSAAAAALPVGTADAGSEITTPLAKGSDFIMANVHPFFGGLPIAQAADWTWQFFQWNDIAATEAASNRPPTYIAETGWPTTSMTPENMTIGGATAGVPQLQTFLDTFPCQANRNGTGYFFFETFDEPWKESFGGVEPYWGMFTSDKVLKTGLTMPTCASS